MRGKILFIDNDIDCLEIYTFLLEAEGFSVTTSSDPNAISSAAEYDLLVLDENLGKVQGSDLCLQLKSNPDTAQIPVVLSSALEDLRSIAKSCSADYILQKPFEISKLEGLVNTAVNKSKKC